jgi:predicted NBD/HSP70 family sugar kinase
MLRSPDSPTGGLGNKNDQARRQNLSMILSLLHREGSLTRAELTRLLDLNRSTIAGLLGELVAMGLVSETAGEGLAAVGRPSFVAQPNSRIAALVVNPDVDAVTVGLVGLGGVVHRRHRAPVTAAPTVAETIGITRDALRRFADATSSVLEVAAAGVAVPGLVSPDSGKVTIAPHLGWHDEPLGDLFGEALGVPTVIANDAHVGLIAETIRGAARGARDVVYLNGSASGIGGGVLMGGTILRGHRGFAAELGHITVGGRRTCHCGRTGCLETEVRLERLEEAVGSRLGSNTLSDLVSRTGQAALVEVDRQLDLLGEALANLAGILDPELFVLGGYLGGLAECRPQHPGLDAAHAPFHPYLSRIGVRRAQLGEDLLLIGAAEAAFTRILTSPADWRQHIVQTESLPVW